MRDILVDVRVPASDTTAIRSSIWSSSGRSRKLGTE
jgi:hypothetical protein